MKVSTDLILIVLLSNCLGCGIGFQPIFRNEQPNYGTDKAIFDSENEQIVPNIGNNITCVFVDGNYTNFNNLRGTKIEELEMRFNGKMFENRMGIDLSFINTLRSLKELTLADVFLADLSFLSGLPLHEITISSYGDSPLALVKVKSMSALKGCPLKHVSLSYFNLDNLDFLDGAPLEVLILSDSRLLSPPDLMAFTKLSAFYAPKSSVDIRSIPKTVILLDLSYCESVLNLDCLASFGKLETLKLPYQSTNLIFCSTLPLHSLWANDCSVEDLSPLLNTPLEVVVVSRTKVSDLSPVKHVSTVYANSTQVVSLIGMEPCSIERLDISECPINSLQGIETFRRLEDIEFNDTAIKDIWRLKSLPTLKHVRFTSADGENISLYRQNTNSPYWGQVFSK